MTAGVEITKGQDWTIEARIFTASGRGPDDLVKVRLTAAAAASATALTVVPLDDALASGDKLLFGENTIVTLSNAAAAGVTTVPVNAIPGPLSAGDVGKKLQDLTSYTIAMEILENRADATPVISKTGASITLATQTGDDRGKVQATGVAADTTSLAVGRFFGAFWRTNAGTSRPLAEFDVSLIARGFL